MGTICHPFVEHLVKGYERELDAIYSFPGVLVVDNSFSNGFLKRRLMRDNIQLNIAEAWYAERLFQERQLPLVHGNNADGTPRYVSFPYVMIGELERGIDSLVRHIDNPYAALANRWGGTQGEPLFPEHRLDPSPGEGATSEARAELVRFIKTLQTMRYIARGSATELFTVHSPAANPTYPQRFETRLGDALGKNIRPKRYFQNQPHVHSGHYRERRESAGLTHSNSRIIEVKSPRSREHVPQAINPDREVYMLARAVGQRHAARVLAADGDFRSLHGFYCRNKPRKDPASTVDLLLDYNGFPEVIRA